MIKKLLVSFFYFLLFLYVATLASAGLIFLIKVGIIVVFPQDVLRNLAYWLIMTLVVFLLMMLIGSNMGYRLFKKDEKFKYSVPIIAMSVCTAIYLFTAVYFRFDSFASGPVCYLASVFLGFSELDAVDYAFYPPAVITSIAVTVLQCVIYTLGAIIGMKHGYKDKIEDEEHHVLIKKYMEEEALMEAVGEKADDTVSEEVKEETK